MDFYSGHRSVLRYACSDSDEIVYDNDITWGPVFSPIFTPVVKEDFVDVLCDR